MKAKPASTLRNAYVSVNLYSEIQKFNAITSINCRLDPEVNYT